MFTPLILPNGSRLPNRLAKAALEENLADEGQLPGPALWRLYRHWGIGGAGLIITGNVMIDGRAMTGPGGVVLEQDTPLAPFETWAKAARQEGAQVWMQLSHPGRQVMANMGGNAWAPSAIPMAMGKYSKQFAPPQAMSEAQITEVIARFAASAHAAEQAGFTGVQIHAAHGYLISQFLSPLSNQRSDRWGGELANRARLLLEVVSAVRQRVSPGFCVAVKLNSADFQRGGFSPDEARQVLLMLNELPVDLVELSGGSYESPAMQGEAADDSTLAREAYFLTFARDLAAVARMPVMTTGGIARPSVAQQVLNSGVAVVGIATAMAEIPDLPHRWQTGEAPHALPAPVKWRDKTLTLLARMALIKRRMHALSRDRTRNVRYSPLWSLLIDRWRTRRTLRRYHAWLRQR
ncbi:TPA: NADH:flavin oxidoreductase/NADH oxidase family protein [Serratia marcescens]|nr:NADH:flavin oxidoreductase/NADH oxidase family protein [Serratia marcescens]HCR2985365.1 NADH:flavin oxidoreductase/NADH oxidase family protein [Serratia marcescens]HCR2986657.1 NADH:flavin oxidoreductase/NADH oxidase family protein [Serratia marcescens]HCR3010598.1 NADH:flavin oxidoreductase/NADH oxidase family protein [Serratia marcescens]HCR3015328.1 NADH:flavin oxidoreductase/NADH oxidase family protein [Serratia marcescens]